ncbi:uncharacterized protein LOC112639142 [Camponotus floridanus]|uniref:uncharacterized protein LOC112639142 n=1 Tax=Camponotus floridanus TaxID=104421 RepID=UPI000DC6822D|nr:uncharacterized protein LOC112639142 [Camponotus floridanus]
MSSYPSSSGEFICGDDDLCEADVPRVRDVSCGPPLPPGRFEQACARVYLRGPLSLRVTYDFELEERIIEEVVPLSLSFLHWEWEFLNIFRAEEARLFEEMRAQQGVGRAARLRLLCRGGPGIGRARGPLPPAHLLEGLRGPGRGHGRPHGR